MNCEVCGHKIHYIGYTPYCPQCEPGVDIPEIERDSSGVPLTRR
jgi:hypothetical protein